VQRRPASQEASSPPQGHRPRALAGLRRVCSSLLPPFLSAGAHRCEVVPQMLGTEALLLRETCGEPEALRALPGGLWCHLPSRLSIDSTAWLREEHIQTPLRSGSCPSPRPHLSGEAGRHRACDPVAGETAAPKGTVRCRHPSGCASATLVRFTSPGTVPRRVPIARARSPEPLAIIC
jgi:hypothetical protein